MRISILQTDIVWENKQENLRRLREKLETLRGTTEIVVLPETFSTGFSMNTASLAEPTTGETIATLRQWSEEYRLALAGSYIACETASEGGKPSYYNRAFFLTPEGNAYYYDKRHLFAPGGEAGEYTPGDHRVVVTYRGVRFLLLVCYDLRFPVWSRSRDDYDAILCCASWPASRRDVWRTLLRARAIENQCFVAGANRTGRDPVSLYSGDSVLLDCRGRALAEAGSDPATLVSSFDLGAQRLFREKFPAWRDADDFRLLL